MLCFKNNNLKNKHYGRRYKKKIIPDNIYINNMDIFRKDKLLKQIQCEIKKNRNNMVSGLYELEETKNQNIHLQEVYDDYKSYHDYIVNMKKDQEIQILSLLHYLEKSMLEAGLTDRLHRQAKHEQEVLLGKLETVRNDLSEITQKAENIKLDRNNYID